MELTPNPVNIRRLAYAYVVDAIGSSATVITRFNPSTPADLPAVLVDAQSPSAISNGRQETTAVNCDIRIACYAADEDEAYDLALSCWSEIHRMWRTGHSTQFGGLALIRRSSLQPDRVESNLDNDDAVCYQFILHVIARAKPSST